MLVSTKNLGNPIGTIISFMGIKAPNGYLVCDGSEYNRNDYSDFCEFLEEQFKNINYFGGGLKPFVYQI